MELFQSRHRLGDPLRTQQGPQLRRPQRLCRPRPDHQHRLPCQRVVQGIAAVVEGSEGHLFAPEGKRSLIQLAALMAGTPAEHHTEHRVGRSSGDGQHLGVKLSVKDSIDHRVGPRQQP